MTVFKRFLVLLLLSLLGFCYYARALAGEKWAVVIGISEYKDRRISDLPYADDDARAIGDILIKEGKFSPQCVEILIDSDATKENIYITIRDWLLPREKKDDLVLIYYSGHGTSSPTTSLAGEKGFEYGTFNAFLLPYDAVAFPSSVPFVGRVTHEGIEEINDTLIPAERLSSFISMLDAKEIVLIFDSCYSGGGGKYILEGASKKGVNITGIIPKTSTKSNFAKDVYERLREESREDKGVKNVVVIASSRGDQLSFQYERLGYSAFTYYIKKAIEDGVGLDDAGKDGKISIKEIFDYAKVKVQQIGAFQTPIVFPSEGPDIYLVEKKWVPEAYMKEYVWKDVYDNVWVPERIEREEEGLFVWRKIIPGHYEKKWVKEKKVVRETPIPGHWE